MDIQDFIAVTDSFTRPRIICKDGFSMSVQCSSMHYSFPREDEGPYSSVEIGFPSHSEEVLHEYAETISDEFPIDWTNSVYGWVPIGIVNDILRKHGGIDIIKTMFKSDEQQATGSRPSQTNQQNDGKSN